MEYNKDDLRNRIFKMRVSKNEIDQIVIYKKKTSERSLSNYARKVLLKEPVTVFHRNQSADDFLAEMLLLKRELNAIGNNFNQVVHKLHTLDRIPEFRHWIVSTQNARNAFLKKTEEISIRMHQIHQLWSQE